MRKPRQLKTGVEYHVVARANRQEFILNNDEVKKILLDIIKRSKKKYKFSLRNFCIMSNHFHLIIKPKKKYELSKIMQWILSVFAVRFNRMYGLHGHVWYDRFKSQIISSFRQLYATFNYIQANPVIAKIVSNAEEYKFTGLNFITQNKTDIVDPPDFLTRLIVKKRLPENYLLIANRELPDF